MVRSRLILLCLLLVVGTVWAPSAFAQTPLLSGQRPH